VLPVDFDLALPVGDRPVQWVRHVQLRTRVAWHNVHPLLTGHTCPSSNSSVLELNITGILPVRPWRDLQRIEVLGEVLAARRTTASASAVLAVSVRQTQRVLTRYRDGGGGALIHKARGRASNYQLSAGIPDYALEADAAELHWVSIRTVGEL
jgi:hypothetical protein